MESKNGRVFHLFSATEDERKYVPGAVETRTAMLLESLREAGYAVKKTYWDREVYSITHPLESGYEELGQINNEILWTRGNEKLEKILEEFEF